MVDLFLLIFVLVIIGAAVFINVKVLLFFQEPADANTAGLLFVKGVIVFSLTLAWMLNILLPIDVRNSRPRPGLIDMAQLWEAAFIILAVFLVFVVPAVMFYTEVEGDDTVKRKGRHVFCNLCITLFFAVAAVAISYPFLSNASIPVVEYQCDRWLGADDMALPGTLAAEPCVVKNHTSMDLKVSFGIYLIAVLCFIGWFFFVTFGGIGLSAVPIDLVLEFVDRPRAINESTYQARRKILGQASAKLIEQAEELQAKELELASSMGWTARRQRRALGVNYNRFKCDVLLLEAQLEKLKVSKFQRGENLAVSTAKLLLGILCAFISLAWVLQIILRIIVPTFDHSKDIPFLDALLTACEGSGLYPLGVALFAIFTLYLCVCVVKGCVKFGMRIFFVMAVHPMRQNGTPLNSVLFNVEMVLLTSAAVVQFAQTAFVDYARLTDADVIFSAQIKYMSFYSLFFKNNVFIWALLAYAVLAFLYLLIRPREGGVVRFDKKSDKKLAEIIGVKDLGLGSSSKKKSGSASSSQA